MWQCVDICQLLSYQQTRGFLPENGVINDDFYNEKKKSRNRENLLKIENQNFVFKLGLL